MVTMTRLCHIHSPSGADGPPALLSPRQIRGGDRYPERGTSKKATQRRVAGFFRYTMEVGGALLG